MFRLTEIDVPKELEDWLLLLADARANRSLVSVIESYAEWLRETPEIDLHSTGEFLFAASLHLASMSGIEVLDGEEAAILDGEGEWPRQRLRDSDPFVLVAQRLNERKDLESWPSAARIDTFAHRVLPRSPGVFAKVWLDMLERSGPALQRVAAPAFVRVEVTISQLVRALRAGTRLNLRHVLRHASRGEAVIHFLAVLELVRQKLVKVEQLVLFDDIVMMGLERDRETASRAG
jgi:chromatin segregation and condensation protein Rec8/ScpA/Scc1 (kleisin family)